MKPNKQNIINDILIELEALVIDGTFIKDYTNNKVR